ncbi:MAG: cytochrome P450 [Ilumatobacteraceae bacterium]|nr:cytochrome P450 [Ilumatobacteraceae bacterium]
MIRLTTYAEAREAYRSKELRQALYDEGDALMHGVIVNLHGPEHLARRRLENRLFRRDTFAWYESAVIPAIIADVLAPSVAAGRGDLLPLARRTMLTLALGVAGVDRIEPDGTPAAAAEIDRLYALMDRLAKASTVAHATGDKAAIVADGDAALDEFRVTYFDAARARRLDLLARLERGEIADDELPRDVLTTLLRNQDRLDLPEATVLREVAYFPWVGSHSTSNQLVHAMHHVLTWLDEHPGDRERLTADAVERQRFVHESLRLHPASPVSLRHVEADVALRSGVVLPAGEVVAIDLVAANRDPAVFGPDADRFDPHRELPAEVAPWGLSFGHGVHACLGQELAGGLELAPGDDLEHHLLGAITVMIGILLEHGARPDPDDPPERDTATTRDVFARYPVTFPTFS